GSELGGIVADGVAAATSAMEDGRGGHAEACVAGVNPLLRRMARLAQKVGQGQRAVTAWPEEPMRDPLEERAVSSAGVEVPPAMGTSAAYPAKLDLLAAWCVSVTERVPTLAAGVGLDDVTAEVTRQPLVFDFPRPAGEWPLRPGRPSLLVQDDPVTEPEPVPVTEPADPAIYVEVPDVSDQVALITETAGFLGAL